MQESVSTGTGVFTILRELHAFLLHVVHWKSRETEDGPDKGPQRLLVNTTISIDTVS